MGKNLAKIDLIYKMCSDFYTRSLEGQLKELGIPTGLSHKEIKKELRQLALKHHPDKGGDPQMFKKILEALKTVGNNSTSIMPTKLTDLESLIDRYSVPPGSIHPDAQRTIPPIQPSIVPKNNVSPVLNEMPIPKDNPKNSIWGNWYQNYIDHRQKT